MAVASIGGTGTFRGIRPSIPLIVLHILFRAAGSGYWLIFSKLTDKRNH
jgi:hypothetical protein